MNKRITLRTWAAMLLFPLLLASCELDSIFGKSDGAITGTIDPGNATLPTVKVQSIEDNQYAEGLAFTVNVLMNNKPQFVIVTDENDNLLMMYRGVMHENENIIINARTTAEALVTFHPLFGPVNGEDYSRLVEIVTSTSYFDSLETAVEHAIARNRSLTDTTNAELTLALHNVMRQVSEAAFANLEKKSRKGLDEDLNCYPLTASTHDSTLELRAPSTCPSYYGEMYRLDNGERTKVSELYVPSMADYSGMTIFDNGRNIEYGEAANVIFPEEGEYEISLSRSNARATTDFYLHLASNVMGVLGINMRETLIYALSVVLENFVDVEDYDQMDAFDMMDMVSRVYCGAADFIDQKPEGLDIWNNWGVTDIMLVQLTDLYKVVRDATNSMMRIVWQMTGTNKDLNFGVRYNAAQGIRSRLNISLQIVSGNNQTAAANMPLDNPLRVKVTARANDGSLVNDPQRVRFRVENGSDGTLSDEIVWTDANGYAQTEYTVGTSGSGTVQRISAEVIDEDSNVVSNIVQFQTLTSNERWRTRLKCIVQDYYVLITDIEFQISANGVDGVMDIVPCSMQGYDYDGSYLRSYTSGTFNTKTREVDLELRTYDAETGTLELARTDRFRAWLTSDYLHSITPYSTTFEPGWTGCDAEIDMTQINAASKGMQSESSKLTTAKSTLPEVSCKFIMRIDR